MHIFTLNNFSQPSLHPTFELFQVFGILDYSNPKISPQIRIFTNILGCIYLITTYLKNAINLMTLFLSSLLYLSVYVAFSMNQNNTVMHELGPKIRGFNSSLFTYFLSQMERKCIGCVMILSNAKLLGPHRQLSNFMERHQHLWGEICQKNTSSYK